MTEVARVVFRTSGRSLSGNSGRGIFARHGVIAGALVTSVRKLLKSSQ